MLGEATGAAVAVTANGGADAGAAAAVGEVTGAGEAAGASAPAGVDGAADDGESAGAGEAAGGDDVPDANAAAGWADPTEEGTGPGAPVAPSVLLGAGAVADAGARAGGAVGAAGAVGTTRTLRASDASGAAGVPDVVVCEAESATGASCFWLDASPFLNRLKKLNMVRNVAVRAPRAGDVGAGNGAPGADRTF
nr:hypothetical protein [Mycetohabitans sp. B8]